MAKCKLFFLIYYFLVHLDTFFSFRFPHQVLIFVGFLGFLSSPYILPHTAQGNERNEIKGKKPGDFSVFVQTVVRTLGASEVALCFGGGYACGSKNNHDLVFLLASSFINRAPAGLFITGK